MVSIWTINSREEFLLTLRDATKEFYPSTWENTEGSALLGEASLEAARRELEEEVGIGVSESDLLFLSSHREQSIFLDTYCVYRDVEATDLRLQPLETVDAKWVSLKELEEMIQKGEIAGPVAARFYRVKEILLGLMARSPGDFPVGG